MKNLNYLIEVASFLKVHDVLAELNYIKERVNSETTELILPIVGEFSSGKTTFINSLTDGKKLETASKSTTSVIYEIHFSNEKNRAEMISHDDQVKLVEDVSTIKNNQLENVKRIKIFDTSKKISSTTILADTPGLSSNDPKHVEALTNYLPNADGLFLFIDINQQITSSLLDFITTKNLLHLPLYLVITKTDTKTKEELEAVKHYISRNINLSLDNIISISSAKDDLEEFYQLMARIQDNKKQIVNNALEYRLEKIAEYLKAYIGDLIQNISPDSDIEVEIKEQRKRLERTLNAIENLISDIHNNIDDIEYGALNQFEKQVFSKLNTLAGQNNGNIDDQARGIVNGTANLVLANYQNEIRKKIFVTASERKNSSLEIPPRSLESIDFSGHHIEGLSYDMNLSEAGQGTVKGISTGIKIAAVIGAVVVTAGAAAAAAGAGAAGAGAAGSGAAGASAAGAGAAGAGAAGASAAGAGAAGAGAAGASAAGASLVTAGTATAAVGSAANLASKAGTIISAADTVSDVVSIQSNRNLRKKIYDQTKNTGKYFQEVKQNLKTYEQYNLQAGQILTPVKKEVGFMEAIVGSATDGVIGKPERKRMINNYLKTSLIPEFKNKMTTISQDLLGDIQHSLNQEAALVINQLEGHLADLDIQRKEQKQDFNDYKKTLEHYLEQL